MTHERIVQKTKEYLKLFDNYPQTLINAWESIPERYRDINDVITGNRIIDLIDKLRKDMTAGLPVDEWAIHGIYQKTCYEWLTLYFSKHEEDIDEAESYYCDLNQMAWDYWMFLNGNKDRYCGLEDQSMDFDGDIVITDPCYLDSNIDNRASFNFNHDDIVAYGIKGIESSTIYGDWSCTTYDRLNSDKEGTLNVIGEFCADSGMVCVCDLQSVLNFNPKFDINPWCRTIIENFKGTVQIKIDENEENCFPEYIVTVVGKGINKETGEPIDFYTKQTGC